MNEEQNSKLNAKKMIPRLRLDMLPNYHLKNQKGSSNPGLNLNLNVVQAANASYNSLIKQKHQQQQEALDAYQTLAVGDYNSTHSSAESLSSPVK